MKSKMKKFILKLLNEKLRQYEELKGSKAFDDSTVQIFTYRTVDWCKRQRDKIDADIAELQAAIKEIEEL